MADVAVDRVVVELEAKLDQYNRNVISSRRVFEQSTGAQVAASQRLERQIRSSTTNIGASFKKLAGTLATSVSVVAIKNLADGYTRFTNQLKVVGLEGEALARNQEDLFQIAQKYGTELESLGTLYSRLSGASKDLGASNQQLLQFTEGVAAALKVQGGSAAEAQGALMQLSQALGGGVVRAEEFNSVLEGARPIAQAVANNIDRFKGSVSALRTAVADGKVTSEEFFRAFLAGSAQLQEQASKANLTIAGSLTVLNNALGKYIGEADASLSATQKFAQAIGILADNLDTIVPLMVALASIMAGRFVVGMAGAALSTNLVSTAIFAMQARAVGAATTMEALALTSATAGRAMLAAFGGPVGLAIVALSGAVYLYNTRLSDTAMKARALEDAHKKLDPILNTVRKSLDGAATSTGRVREEYLKAADAAFTLGEAEVASARKSVAAAKARLEAAQGSDQRRLDMAAGNPYPGINAAYEEAALGKARADLKAAEQVLIDAGLATRRGSRGQGTTLRTIKPSDTFQDGGSGGGGGAAAGDDKKSKKGASGPTREELAARREVLEIQNRLNVAQALGDEKKVQALQDQLDLIRLTDDYRESGLKKDDAEIAAAEQLLRLRLARAEVESMRRLEVDTDPSGFRKAGEDLPDLVFGPDGSLISPEQYEEMRRDLKGTILDAFDASRDGLGGLAEYFGNKLKASLLDSLADQLAQIILNLPKPGGSAIGGGLFSSIAGAVGGLVSKIPGRKAGGDVVAGQAYYVHQDEVFVPPVSGKMVKNTALQGSRGRATVIQPIFQSFDGAVVTEKLMAQANANAEMAAEKAGRKAYSMAVRDAPAAISRQTAERK